MSTFFFTNREPKNLLKSVKLSLIFIWLYPIERATFQFWVKSRLINLFVFFLKLWNLFSIESFEKFLVCESSFWIERETFFFSQTNCLIFNKMGDDNIFSKSHSNERRCSLHILLWHFLRSCETKVVVMRYKCLIKPCISKYSAIAAFQSTLVDKKKKTDNSVVC